MKFPKSARLVILAGLAGFLGILLMRGQRSETQQKAEPATVTNVDVVVSYMPTNGGSTALRPIYGKDSLTHEEHKIIHKAFDEKHVKGIYQRIYRVGMICLKRRLNYWEVKELIEGKIVPRMSLPVDGERIGYYFPASHSLGLWFDTDGKLQRVIMFGDARYEFPTLESVTLETSIEPPPKTTENAP